MKKRAKIIATSTVASITFLIISAYHTESTSSPISPPNCPVSWVVEVGKTYTSPLETKPLVGDEMPKISTQIEAIIEPTNTPTTPIQVATKPATPTPKEPTTPQTGEDECIYVWDMYESGNKIGIMGQSDGDINKIVGTMD